MIPGVRTEHDSTTFPERCPYTPYSSSTGPLLSPGFPPATGDERAILGGMGTAATAGPELPHRLIEKVVIRPDSEHVVAQHPLTASTRRNIDQRYARHL
jgi:hypothetical protein